MTHAAHAADSSVWDGDNRSAARLLSAGARSIAGRPVLRAGVEIRLSPGWKTYWRYPGDSGVPPHFDFDKSTNVKSIQVLWPAPQKIKDSEGVTIGYRSGIVFPLLVEPRDAGKPVSLNLRLDYAICERLCVPVQATAEIALDGRPTQHEAAVARAEGRVPRKQQLGAAAPLSIRAVTKDETANPPRILVDVAAPAGVKAELFAEGPNSQWALPVPEPAGGASDGLQHFSFALDGLPPGADAKGAVLKITAAAGDHAIETSVPLD